MLQQLCFSDDAKQKDFAYYVTLYDNSYITYIYIYISGVLFVRPAWVITSRWKSDTRPTVGSVSWWQGCPWWHGIWRKLKAKLWANEQKLDRRQGTWVRLHNKLKPEDCQKKVCHVNQVAKWSESDYTLPGEILWGHRKRMQPRWRHVAQSQEVSRGHSSEENLWKQEGAKDWTVNNGLDWNNSHPPYWTGNNESACL